MSLNREFTSLGMVWHVLKVLGVDSQMILTTTELENEYIKGLSFPPRLGKIYYDMMPHLSNFSFLIQ